MVHANAVLRFKRQMAGCSVCKTVSRGANNTEIGSSDASSVQATVKSATMVLTSIPIICVYPFVQKYFVQGMTIGAVKG